MADNYIRWFADLRAKDVDIVGGKNASLGELYAAFPPGEVQVPNGFAVTARAYRDALDEARAWEPLHALLDGFDKSDVAALSEREAKARAIIFEATGGAELRRQILAAYRELMRQSDAGTAVAVRSSATAEDLP